MRGAVLACGANILSGFLTEQGTGRREEVVVCGCGERMESQGVRPKELLTILGPVTYERSMFQCPACQATRYPGDEALDVVGTTRSPGLRRMMARAGSQSTFKDGRDDLKIYAGLEVSAKDVERVAERIGQEMDTWGEQERQDLLREASSPEPNKDIPVMYVSYDGTGVPMRPEELIGVKGKHADGMAKTREAKLGCVFTQTTRDEQDNPVRDPHSTTYVGAIESSSDFGHRLCQEAHRRGLKRAQKLVLLSDGATYNHAVAREHFPLATHIIDFYHASERLTLFVKENTAHSVPGAYHQQGYALLEDGRIEELIDHMRQALPHRGARRKAGMKQIRYYAERVEQMRYAQFRAQGLFVGSGVIEAGCKTLIGKRLKQPGMFWSVPGANAIIAARCCLYSGRFEQFWESAGS